MKLPNEKGELFLTWSIAVKSKKNAQRIWVEVVDCALYISNIYATMNFSNKTPLEAWNEGKLNVKHLRLFGSIAYIICTCPIKIVQN